MLNKEKYQTQQKKQRYMDKIKYSLMQLNQRFNEKPVEKKETLRNKIIITQKHDEEFRILNKRVNGFYGTNIIEDQALPNEKKAAQSAQDQLRKIDWQNDLYGCKKPLILNNTQILRLSAQQPQYLEQRRKIDQNEVYKYKCKEAFSLGGFI